MDDNDEDEIFGDDGFDSLPRDELLQLEQSALRATQQQADLNRSGPYLKTLPQPALARPQLGLKTLPTPSLRRAALDSRAPVQHSSSDYGEFYPDDVDPDLDEPVPVEEADDTIPSLLPGEVTQRGQWQQRRYGQRGTFTQGEVTTSRPRQMGHRGPPSTRLFSVGASSSQIGQPSLPKASLPSRPASSQNADSETLRAQVQQLLQERESLRHELSTVNSSMLAKQGEISIIRANQARTSQNYDRQIATLQRTMTEEAAAYKMRLDAVVAESKRVQTENQFLKQDLSEEGAKVKNLQRNLKGKEKATNAGTETTPKKQTSRAFQNIGDGFNDDEIAVISPSKSGRRSKRGTPTAGAKRKRGVTHDSPVPALELTQTRQELDSYEGAAESFAEEPVPIAIDHEPASESSPLKVKPDHRNFRFVQRILNYKTDFDQKRILEASTCFAFPSAQGKALSSVLIERATALAPEAYPVRFTRMIIDLWKQCLDEKYHEPIALLIDTLRFILGQDAMAIAPHITDVLVPVIHASGEINGVPRFKSSASSNLNLSRFRPTPKKQLDPLVNTTECLRTLYAAAAGCLHNEISLRSFWQLVQFDFILMMLNSSQPIVDIIINLNLLATSIFPTTFGPILASAQDQTNNENYIIERVSCLLMEKLVPDEGVPFPSVAETCELRIEALSLLSELALGDSHPHRDLSAEPHHGSLLLARHPTFLARLIRSIYDELEMIYTDPPTAELHFYLINNAIRLVYHIFKLHPTDIDMKPKWAAVPGGVQKQLIALSRLAFSDGPWLERGIDDDVAEMAHELLEDVVNLEEAGMVVQAFPHMATAETNASAKDVQEIDADEEMAADEMEAEELAADKMDSNGMNPEKTGNAGGAAGEAAASSPLLI